MKRRLTALLTVAVTIFSLFADFIPAAAEDAAVFDANANDITVSATSANTNFYTYDTGSGSTPENLTINLTITLTKSNIEGGYVLLPYDFFPTVETHPNFTMDDPIFEFLEINASGTAEDSIIDDYDAGSDSLVLYIKDGMTATQQAVAVKFRLNSAYLNKIPNGSPLWSVKLEAYVGEIKVYDVNGPSIKSASSFSASSGVTRLTPADSIYMDGAVTVRFSHTASNSSQCELDTDYDNIYYIELPNDSILGSGILDYYDGGIQDMGNGYTRYIKILTGNNLSGTTMDRSFTPPAMDTGTGFHFRVGYDYKLLNGVSAQGHKDLEYVKEDPLDWKLYLATHHTSGGANIPRVDITGTSSTTTEGTAGWSTYTHSYTSKNEGTASAPGVRFVLYQESSGSPKAAFDKITLCVSRETTATAWSTYKVLFNIKNARDTSGASGRSFDSGLYTPTASTISQTITVKLPALEPGEYIDEVVVIPMGTDGASEGVWPSKNGLGIRYHPTMWSDGLWPDGTPIADYNKVPLSARIYYNNPQSGETDIIHQADTYYAYYVATNTTAASATLYATNYTSLAPGDTVQGEIRGINNSYYGISLWENPRIVIRVPAQIELDSLNNKDLTDVKSGEVYQGIVAVEKLPSSNETYNYYLLQVSGYAAPLTAGENTAFTIPVTFRVVVGAAPGSYPVNRILVSNDDPKTFRQIQATSSYTLNNIPSGESAANYGFEDSEFYTARTSTAFTLSIRTQGNLTAATAIRGLGTDEQWSTATLVPAQNGEIVEMRVVIENKGNTTYSSIRLYDILPKDGDMLGSTGSISFVGVEGPSSATVWYSSSTALAAYGQHNNGGSTEPNLQSFSTTGWSTAKPANPTAVFINFGSTQIKPGESVEVILKFLVPEGADSQTAFNQFRFSGKDTANTEFNINSTVSGFSTEAIALVYDANLPDFTVDEVSGMPEASSKTYNIGDNTLTVASDNPTLTGYTFESWYDNEDGTGNAFASGTAMTFDSSGTITLYAKWTPVKVRINFDKNGGDTEANPNYCDLDFGAYMSNNDFPNIEPTRANNSFGGWSTSSGENNNPNYMVGTRIESTLPKTLYAVWANNQYTVTFYDEDGTAQLGASTVDYGSGANKPNDPEKAATAQYTYTFAGWAAMDNYTGGLDNVQENMSYKASYTSQVNRYTVTFEPNGGTEVESQEVNYGETATQLEAPTRSGCTFRGWHTDDETFLNEYDFNTPVTEDITLYANWSRNSDGGIITPTPEPESEPEPEPEPESGGGSTTSDGHEIGGGSGRDPSNPYDDIIIIGEEDLPLGSLEYIIHIRYLNGYPNGSVKPESAITRAEAASIFYRLLKETYTDGKASTAFSDVSPDAWYSLAVSTLAEAGILNGYPDGTFKPDQPITRAEFTALASRFDRLILTTGTAFSDVTEDHWVAKYINSAYVKGWIDGYPDYSFKPENSITRAEVVTIVNKMLNRAIDDEALAAVTTPYDDISNSHWYYANIIEASMTHEYEMDDEETEIWRIW